MKHCHESSVKVSIPPGARKIVLAGNPNTGKSVFFNFLTGVYVDVSNYPGTTLEISSGHFGGDIVIDTPGVYGLSSFNDEERVARDVILEADIVLNIVDAVHLERDLFLTQQLIDTGVPVLVALNMMDEAANQHLKIDVDRLAELLDVPVIPTVAVHKQDLQKVAAAIGRARPGWVDPRLRTLLAELQPPVASQGEALLILEGDPVIAERNGLAPHDRREAIYLQRRERINVITAQTVQSGSERRTFSQNLGNLMLDPLSGWLILALALWITYQFIGVCVAGTVVDFTEKTVMTGYYEPLVREIITRVITPHSPLGQILIGDFGLFTMTVTYLLGLLFPLVVGFYLMLSLFEDSGYLPRIATLVDRAMNAIGLNGKAVIPLILGFGCVTVATITTRLLGSDRERRIAIFLLGLAIPCSAQLGVIAGLLAKVGFGYALLYVGVIFAVLVMVGTLLKAVIPGKTMDLLINLPPLRLPRAGNVLKKTYTKSLGFLAEAAPLFAIGALIISLLQISGSLELLQRILAPVTTDWLGLPVQAANAFIMGIIRRDFGAAGLSSMGLDPLQTVVSLITITLFVPCIASIMVMFKERSKIEAALMWLSTWVIAFFTGGLVNQIARLFHQ
jgi:ferrous iron transport protein B